MITFGSLFSGIGGFDLAFEQAGMVCKWQVEIDDRAGAVLGTHWPGVAKYKDVRDVGAGNLEPVDVICGGFPCQDLSVAGKRGGLAGERSGLWYEFHRIVAELKPRWVVVENVPGLLSSNEGRDFAVILSGLAECGYLSAWRILDAQYFGLAQRRKRVFIVASLGNGNAAKVLFEREGGRWDTPKGGETGQELARDIAASLKGGSGERGFPIEWKAGLATYAITERTRANGRNLEVQKELAYALDNPGEGGRTQKRLVAFGGNNTSRGIDKATAVNAHGSRRYDFESETFVCNTLSSRMGRYSSPDPATGKGSPIVVTNTFNGYTGGADDNDAQGWHIVPALAFTERTRTNGRNFEAQEEVAYPLTDGSKGGTPHSSRIAGIFGVRRLTPTECERLQGFPDGWTAGQSDSARYQQLGNAVAVPVARWIGERIIAAEAA